jgi:signal transduction histidine kinase
MATYDSLYSKIYSGGVFEDSVKVRLLYQLAKAVASAGVQDHTEKGRKIEGVEYYYFEALRLSLILNYKHGIELFFETLSDINKQITGLMVLGYTGYDSDISDKFKDLRLYRNKKHFGSLDNYLRAVQKLREINPEVETYKLEYWVGLVYFDWFNYKRSIEHLKIAAGSNAIKNDSITLYEVYHYTGASCFYMKNYDSSIYCFNKSLTIAEKKCDQFRSGISLINLGEVYCRIFDFSAALEYFKKSLDHFRSTRDSVYIAYSLNEMGRVYIALKKFAAAEDVLTESLNISNPLKDNFLTGKIYNNLEMLYSSQGDYRKAYLYQSEFYKIKETFIINEFSSFFSSYEENWQNAIGREITKKESEALKRGETTIDLNKSRLSQLVLGLAIIFVLIIAIYTFRLYQLKKKANIYLSELNRSREEMLSVISHDVRGPVTGFVDLLEPLNKQINNYSPEQVSQIIKPILNLSQSIKLLVDNLLEWTKAQQGLISCQPEKFLLADVIRQNVEIYQQIADSKEITFSYSIQPEIKVFADHNMIQIVIRNLLNNAVKFTRSGGKILISTHKEGDKIIVSIADTGIGISNDLLVTLFNKGNLLNDSESRRKNPGLGLILCKEYIEKCGGEIWAESDGKDNGSTFFFTLKSSD